MRVIEVGSIVFAPLATQHLGDMGADVIKIEPPEGDMARWIGPRRSDGMGAMFMNINRNKRSVVLDLKGEHGAEILRELAGSADAIVTSVRTAAAQRIDLSYESLSARNPRLVFCHAKGFSDDGAYAGKPAYDDVIQSLSGLADLQTIVGGEPRFVPTIMADKVSSLHAAYAVTLALLHRERTGRGQYIDLPMFEIMTAFNTSEHLWGYAFEPPLEDMGYKPIRRASRRPYKTTDGYLVVLPYSDQHWQRFFDASGRPELMDDPRFATFAERQANYDFVFGSLAQQLATRSTAEWIELLQHVDVPFAVVNGLEDLANDPHLQSVDFWELRDHPTEGRVRVARNPIEMSESPASIRRLAPRLGEHTEEVLHEMGIEATTPASTAPR
jgi:crotonobetainyl-CoA:carnitine CoA-transferase CaiB-like acyl-CoA transferase